MERERRSRDPYCSGFRDTHAAFRDAGRQERRSPPGRMCPAASDAGLDFRRKACLTLMPSLRAGLLLTTEGTTLLLLPSLDIDQDVAGQGLDILAGWDSQAGSEVSSAHVPVGGMRNGNCPAGRSGSDGTGI